MFPSFSFSLLSFLSKINKLKKKQKTHKKEKALTSVAQLAGHYHAERKVTGSIPSQGTCLDCGLGPGHGPWGRSSTSIGIYTLVFLFFFYYRFNLFNFRERRRDGEREGEKHQGVWYIHWLPLTRPQLGAWPIT